MAIVAKTHTDKLPELKKKVVEAYDYFKDNRSNYTKFKRFTFVTNIENSEKNDLDILKRPPLQFNILESYVSRLLGEFSKQTPSIEVSAQPTDQQPDPKMISTIEGHMRAIFDTLDANEVYRDIMGGGYSVMKIYTAYENEKSFNQCIYLKRVFDPLLTGFDPMAQKATKEDGNYAFEIFPMLEDEFKNLYPNADTDQMWQNRHVVGFKWLYGEKERKIILLCHLYEKKKKRVKIHRLSDNSIRTDKEYKQLLEQYELDNDIRQPPIPVESRMADICVICRYDFVQDEVLAYVETDFKQLPLIFVDGNSTIVRRDGDNSEITQVTRPYIYNAVGAQKFMNMTGQVMAREIELMITHKMKVAKESIPPEYKEAYTDVQSPSNYIYNAYMSDKVTPLPPPTEVVKMPLPPEVTQAFTGAFQLVQNILGSYDASLGINNNQLSGVAIVEGATQSNATSMPYIVSLLAAYQCAAEIAMDLIPKYYVTPRSIPVITKDNKHAFQVINKPGDPNSIKISYNSSDLKIKVKAGVNFEIQKNKALQVLSMLGTTFPAIGAILNQEGLPFIFDNLDIRGADELKQIATNYVKKQQMMQAQAQQQGQQASPEMLDIQLKHQKLVATTQVEQQKILLQQQQLQQNERKMQIDAALQHQDNVIQIQKDATERAVHHAELNLKTTDQKHEHAHDAMQHSKEIMKMHQEGAHRNADREQLREQQRESIAASQQGQPSGE